LEKFFVSNKLREIIDNVQNENENMFEKLGILTKQIAEKTKLI